jgi:hypothetical protein
MIPGFLFEPMKRLTKATRHGLAATRIAAPLAEQRSRLNLRQR